jgi:hypothetical protein
LLAHLGRGKPASILRRSSLFLRPRRRTFSKNSGRILVSWSAGAGHRFGFSIGSLDPIQSSVQPEHSRTPSWPQNILSNGGTWAIPNLFAASRLGVSPLPLLPPGACSQTSLAFAESSGAHSSHQVGVWPSIPINGGQPPAMVHLRSRNNGPNLIPSAERLDFCRRIIGSQRRNRNLRTDPRTGNRRNHRRTRK